MSRTTSLGFTSAIVLTLGLSVSGAQAFVARPLMADASVGSLVTPVAMCGSSRREFKMCN